MKIEHHKRNTKITFSKEENEKILHEVSMFTEHVDSSRFLKSNTLYDKVYIKYKQVCVCVPESA